MVMKVMSAVLFVIVAGTAQYIEGKDRGDTAFRLMGMITNVVVLAERGVGMRFTLVNPNPQPMSFRYNYADALLFHDQNGIVRYRCVIDPRGTLTQSTKIIVSDDQFTIAANTSHDYDIQLDSKEILEGLTSSKAADWWDLKRFLESTDYGSVSLSIRLQLPTQSDTSGRMSAWLLIGVNSKVKVGWTTGNYSFEPGIKSGAARAWSESADNESGYGK